MAASSCGSISCVGPSYLWWCTGGRPAGGTEEEEEEGRRVLLGALEGAAGPMPGLGPAGSEPACASGPSHCVDLPVSAPSFGGWLLQPTVVQRLIAVGSAESCITGHTSLSLV